RRRPVHPRRAAVRLRHHRRPTLLAGCRGRLGAHRRRLRRPDSARRCHAQCTVSKPLQTQRVETKGRPVNRKYVMPVAGALGAVVLTVSMASCTSSKPQSSGSAETSGGATAPTSEAAATTVTAPQKASKNYNIQLLQGVIGDQFYITMQCGAQEE